MEGPSLLLAHLGLRLMVVICIFFCRLPWINLLFSEKTVMTVRSRYRGDGALRYEDVESGLNKMSLRRFERLLESSRFRIEWIRYRGVKGQDWVRRFPVLRELLTNHVTCSLIRPSGP